MFIARMICSDGACAETTDVEVATLAELETPACACGCTFEVIGWPDWVDAGEAVVVDADFRRRGARHLRDAA